MQQPEEVELEVFRAGDYGAKGEYTERDLQAMAEDYRPGLLEAPLTFDHAQAGPAFGWVSALRREGTRLFAVLRGVPQAVRQVGRSGAYKRCSIELVRNLPDTGRPYVRAISLLGAATPQVKGLAEIKFADDQAIAFPELPEAGATRSAESPSSASEGMPQACECVDANSQTACGGPRETEPAASRSVESNKQAACDSLGKKDQQADTKDRAGMDMKENAVATDAVSQALAVAAEERDRALESELGELRREIADLRRELRARSTDAVFCELRGEGYVIPEGDAMALSQLAAHFEGEVVQFSEGRQMPVAEWLRSFVRGWAVRVPLVSAAAHPGLSVGPGCEAGLVDHARMDPASVELHHRALALLKSGNASSYAQAVASAAR
jgi:hypothetical protein